MKTSSLFRAGVASLALAAVSISAHAQQGPKPTPEMQAIIDKDNGRHFGTSPEDAGPLAKDISPALTPAAIDTVMRKVADWQLKESQPYFDRIWTWSVRLWKRNDNDCRKNVRARSSLMSTLCDRNDSRGSFNSIVTTIWRGNPMRLSRDPTMTHMSPIPNWISVST